MFLQPIGPPRSQEEAHNPTHLGLISFYANAKSYNELKDGEVGEDGKTSNPNLLSFSSSHHIFARFHKLVQDFQQQPLHLASYLGAAKTSYGQIILASSVTGESLADRLIRQGPITSKDNLKGLINQLLFAIEHLHGMGMIIGNLKVENVFLDANDRLQLFNYGLYTVTGAGYDVAFSFVDAEYQAPEIVDKDRPVLTRSTDIWALGILLLKIWSGKKDVITSGAPNIPDDGDVDAEFKSFLSHCLDPNPLSRASIPRLYNHSFMSNIEKPNTWFKRPFIPSNIEDAAIHAIETFRPTLFELYHLWTIFGGDLKREVPDLATKRPPILSIPTWVPKHANIEELVLKMQDRPTSLADIKYVSLAPVVAAIQKLRESMDLCTTALGRYNDVWKYFPTFDQAHVDELWEQYQTKPPSQLNSKLKERDMEYQFLRLFRFNSLLASYPLTEEQIKLEAVSDIPPLMRGQIWAAILGVRGDPELFYQEFNNEEPCETDRQLDLDIPRCHQYHDQLSTPWGHAKLKTLLRAWIKSEEGKQVYWQGMDSLAACFVTLNFANEALAFVSMKKFIDRFCKGFFVLDNSKVMREHMLTFRYLVSFHDPELSYHLHSIGLGPEFYGISWFMTLFAHVFPLEKIYLLWDHFLTGAEFFFMYTALGILKQLRDQLLTSDFTNGMLVFADLGNVNVETCIIDSIRYSKITPPSIFDFLRDAIHASTEASSPENSRFSFLSTKTSILPSISLEDFIAIGSQTLVLDARPLAVAMKSGHISNSIVISLDGFGPKDNFSQGLQILLERKHFTVIVSSEDKCELGMILLKMKQPRVSLLDPVLFAEENNDLCQCDLIFFGNQFQSKCMGGNNNSN